MEKPEKLFCIIKLFTFGGWNAVQRKTPSLDRVRKIMPKFLLFGHPFSGPHSFRVSLVRLWSDCIS